MSNTTSIEIADGIAWITMDDGKVNALNAELIGEVSAALKAAERAGAVIVLTGREGIFSAGFDLTTFGRGAEESATMVRAGAELILQILAVPLPAMTPKKPSTPGTPKAEPLIVTVAESLGFQRTACSV